MKNKKIIIICLVVLGALALAGGVYAYFSTNSRNYTPTETTRDVNEVDYSGPKQTDKVQPSSKDAELTKPTVNPQQNNSTPSSGSPVTTSITHARQDSNTVQIRSLVEGSTSGTCTLTFSRGDVTITREAPYSAQASYVICQGFNIPVSDFTESGEWKVTVTASGSEGQATASSTVMVKK